MTMASNKQNIHNLPSFVALFHDHCSVEMNVTWTLSTVKLCPSGYWPDSVGQVVPAEVDGSGAVLDGLVEGHRTGAGQVDAGLLCVTVKHWAQVEGEVEEEKMTDSD